MTDQAPVTRAPSSAISMNSTWRIVFGCIALLFFGIVIVYLIMYGNDKNSLHQSALSWSYLGVMGVLAAFGFGAVIDMLPYVFNKK